jgi:hypothetical protein
MDQFRWFTGGWRVNAELPVPASFDAAAKTVREQDVTAQMPCGPDLQSHVAGIREFAAAGYTHVALVQIGADTQERFISWAATELLPALRASDRPSGRLSHPPASAPASWNYARAAGGPLKFPRSSWPSRSPEITAATSTPTGCCAPARSGT